MEFSRAQWRCWDCLLTGIYIHRGNDFRFLTLTSANGMKRDMMKCFTLLKYRIDNLTPLKLIESGYVDGNRLNDFYPNTDLNDRLRFDYLCVKTSEGVKGVLHIVFVGDFIPTRWLWDNWENITGVAKSVKIKRVKDFDIVAKYVVNQSELMGYVAGQSKYVRFSYSKDWVFDGYSKKYDKFMSSFWYRELTNIAKPKGLKCLPLDAYGFFKSLTKDERNDFYKKRWSEWLHFVDFEKNS
jgi:hypothetical protein